MKIDLNTVEGRDIASAIRGPDFDSGSLKYILTGPIRHLAGIESGYLVVRDRPLKFYDVELAAQEIVSVMLGSNSSGVHHYLVHCKRALRALGHDYPTEPLIRFIDTITHSLSVGRVTQALRELIEAERGLMWLQQEKGDQDE